MRPAVNNSRLSDLRARVDDADRAPRVIEVGGGGGGSSILRAKTAASPGTGATIIADLYGNGWSSAATESGVSVHRAGIQAGEPIEADADILVTNIGGTYELIGEARWAT